MKNTIHPHQGWIAARAPKRLNSKHRRFFKAFFQFSRPMRKNSLQWHEMGPGGFFLTNPDLADIFGDMDFDFENFHFLDFFRIQHFQSSRSQISGLGQPWAGLGQAWAGPGSSAKKKMVCCSSFSPFLMPALRDAG